MQIKRIIISFLIVIFTINIDSNACLYENRPYALLSNNMAYVVEFIPSQIYGENGIGNVFEMEGKNKGKLLWSVKFYTPPYNIHLSNSGDQLIKVNTLSGRKKRNRLIEFYNKDGLYKYYSGKDLIKNRKKITISTAGAHWVATKPYKENYFDESMQVFRIAVVDQNVYEFDLETGLIINNYIDSCAVNVWELFEKRSKFCQNLLEKVPDLHNLTKYFAVSNISGNGETYHKMNWNAHLKPLEVLPFNSIIEFETEVNVDSSTTTIVLTPQDIINTLLSIYNKPYVKNRINESDKNSLRIRISGNRYNQDNFDINGYMKTLKQNSITVPEDKEWVQFFIDQERYKQSDKTLSFFYPLKTNVIFSSSINSMDEIIFKEKERELCGSVTDSAYECILTIDTIGNFNALHYLKENDKNDSFSKVLSKETEYDLSKYLRRDYFEVYFEKGQQFGTSFQKKLLHYTGEPDEIIDLKCKNEKVYFFKNSYINKIWIWNDTHIIGIEAKKY